MEFKKTIEQKLQVADLFTGSIHQIECISSYVTETMDKLLGKQILNKKPLIMEKIIKLYDQQRKLRAQRKIAETWREQ